MSAFKFEGNIPITGISSARLPDTETIKNAFEINGPLIEKILAICQSPSEANKWVELLGRGSPGAIDIKRNTSFNSGLQPSVSFLSVTQKFLSPFRSLIHSRDKTNLKFPFLIPIDCISLEGECSRFSWLLHQLENFL